MSGAYPGSARGVGYPILRTEGAVDIDAVLAGISVLTGFARLLDIAIQRRLMVWRPYAGETEPV